MIVIEESTHEHRCWATIGIVAMREQRSRMRDVVVSCFDETGSELLDTRRSASRPSCTSFFLPLFFSNHCTMFLASISTSISSWTTNERGIDTILQFDQVVDASRFCLLHACYRSTGDVAVSNLLQLFHMRCALKSADELAFRRSGAERVVGI
jgi:hypothetical protein